MAAVNHTVIGRSAHPNDLDRKRIERALKARRRYRHVSPSVASVCGGYRIESPCCSRNIEPAGGVIDVALLLHDADRATWQLFRKDHQKERWEQHSTYDRLVDLLEQLNDDPARQFWE